MTLGVGRGHHAIHLGPALGSGAAGQLGEEPAHPGRQVGDLGPGRADQVDDAPVQPLAGREGTRPVGRGEDRGHRVSGLGHGRVAEGDQQPLRRFLDQLDGGVEHQAQGALGAHQEPVQPTLPLRQQVLHGVAADLPVEPAEVGAHVGEVDVDQAGQRGGRARFRGRCVWAHREDLAGAERDGEPGNVVGGATVAQGARAAGVVADHAADGAPGVGRRVGPEPQAQRADRPLQGGVDHARLDHRPPRLGVDRADPGEVSGTVDHDAGSDRVAGDGGAGAPGGDGDASAAPDVEDGQQLVGMARPDHDRRDHAVERGVGGVERPGQGGVVDVGHPVAAQGGDELSAHQSSMEAANTADRSSPVTGRGAVASSRCCCRAPSTSAGTSAAP